MKRDLLSLKDFSPAEIIRILELAAQLKKDRSLCRDHLKGKSLALVFQKPSNRTRVSFEVGIAQLGGSCVYLGPDEINLGVRESVHDVAKTLSRYLDGIVARTNTHSDLEELAANATIPIINGLSDLYHPCQALADLLTAQERFATLKGLKLAYVGDGNNVCHSLMIICAKVGVHMVIASPKGYEPSAAVMEEAQHFAAQSGAHLSVVHKPQDGVKGAHIIYNDVWVSMGQEQESERRLKDFQGFQVDTNLVRHAANDFIYMHCLPAHRGIEVSADVIDGPHSVIFDEAENRLHAQKAVLVTLLK